MQYNNRNAHTLRKSPLVRFILFEWIKKNILIEIISIWFVVLFLYTGIAKLMDWVVFTEQLKESPVLAPVASVIVWGLPITEFIIALLLFIPRYRYMGLIVTAILMMLFTGYVIAVLTTSTELPCSCGGIVEQLSWQGHLFFNSFLILLAILAVMMQRRLNRIKRIQDEL